MFTAVAKDDDRGKYGHLSYAIQSDTSLDVFNINSATGKLLFFIIYTILNKTILLLMFIFLNAAIGVITLKRKLDRENQYLHEVPIVAVDDGGRTGYTYLKVTIGDINDNAPQFQANEYKASIHANMSVGTTILTVCIVKL